MTKSIKDFNSIQEFIKYIKTDATEMYNAFIKDCVQWNNEAQTVEEFINSEDFEEEFYNWYETV
jgi:hypothetical protein